MVPIDRRPTEEHSGDSITGYRIQQLEAKQDITNEQLAKVLENLGDIKTQMALGNTRMDASEKRLDVIEADKRATAGLYTSILALLGAIGSGLAAIFTRHAPVLVAALLMVGCAVRNAVPTAPLTPTQQAAAAVVDQFNYLYVLAVLLLALAAFLAFEGSLKLAGLIAAGAGALIGACLSVTYVVTHAGMFLLLGAGIGAGALIYHYRAKFAAIKETILAKVAKAFAEQKPPTT